MSRKLWSIGVFILVLGTGAIADTIWSYPLPTNFNKIEYRWRRIDFNGLSSICEIEMTGPWRASVRATATFELRNERVTRTVSGYFFEGRTTDTISGCDRVVDVVVDRFTP